MWRCHSDDDDRPIHVWPESDLREHDTSGAPCWCGASEDDEGVVVHSSADGREDYETQRRKPN